MSETDQKATLTAQRERLTENFAIMQSELGGMFYEMAIRDHVRMDVLMRRPPSSSGSTRSWPRSSTCSRAAAASAGGTAPPAARSMRAAPRSAPSAPTP